MQIQCTSLAVTPPYRYSPGSPMTPLRLLPDCPTGLTRELLFSLEVRRAQQRDSAPAATCVPADARARADGHVEEAARARALVAPGPSARSRPAHAHTHNTSPAGPPWTADRRQEAHRHRHRRDSKQAATRVRHARSGRSAPGRGERMDGAERPIASRARQPRSTERRARERGDRARETERPRSRRSGVRPP